MVEQIDILQELDGLQQAGLDAISTIQDEDSLQAWRIAHLGRNAPVMLIFARLGTVPKETRPLVGQRANQVKTVLEAAYTGREQTMREESLRRSLVGDKLDITLPGRKPILGRLHPQTQLLRDIYHIFAEMGFQVFHSPDVESDDYNFTLLNMPPYHPARDMQDSFYTNIPGYILRTHTSPGQIHAMRKYAPKPIRVILPGMCYRYEQISTRSEIQFFQVEVLAVGKHITFGDLKGTINEFARKMYGSNARTRLRPSYFPFTEPSAELDVECFVCGGKGCSICKYAGWLEVLGCGMVHPTVLHNGGYDPEQFSGFAAGMGIARMQMLRNHIDDIRYFWSNDIRFLEQF